VTLIRDAAWAVVWDRASGAHAYARDIDVAFAGDTLIHVGKGYAGPTPAETIDGRRWFVMPGLVNIHSHPSSEAMNKGFTDEVVSEKLYMSSLYEFLPVSRPDAAGVRAAAQVAFAELMLSGVTTVADLSMPWDGWLDLLGESGLRVCACPMYRSGRWFTANGHRVDYEWDAPAGQRAMDEAMRVIDRARQHPSGRLFGMVGPAQIDTCTPELLRDSLDAAVEKQVPLQLHAAQSVVEFHEMVRRHGMTPIQWLDDLGLLTDRTIIGHGIFLDHHSWLHWPTRTDLGRLAATGTTVAHCPTVFCRRGITLEDFGGYRAAGVNMGIGTDTYPHNMLEEMRTAAILARTTRGNAAATTTAELFHAATIGGAGALGRDDIGRLAPGAKADLALVDVTHPAMRPVRDPLRSMIYAAAERAVREVFVGGERVVHDGVCMTIDLPAAAAALEDAQRRAHAEVARFDWAKRPSEVLAPLTFPWARPDA
jgi:cytosine/adenosine deaminase-related metal-dependent hydrolase